MSEASKLPPGATPTLTATVEFISCQTGALVSRTFEVTRDDINDVPWYGGQCGDHFFDAEFQSNEERFEQRLRDWVHLLLWDGESEVIPVDPDLNGEHPDGLGYHDPLQVTWTSDFQQEDFYPSQDRGR